MHDDVASCLVTSKRGLVVIVSLEFAMRTHLGSSAIFRGPDIQRFVVGERNLPSNPQRSDTQITEEIMYTYDL